MIRRVVIDTNIWISYLLSPNFNFLDQLILKDKIRVAVSRDLLIELSQVLVRPKFQSRISKEEISKIIEFLNYSGESVKVTSEVEICRDMKDNFLLTLAKDAKADFIISGDKDLLILKKFHQTRIVSISEFKDFILR